MSFIKLVKLFWCLQFFVSPDNFSRMAANYQIYPKMINFDLSAEMYLRYLRKFEDGFSGILGWNNTNRQQTIFICER